MNTFILTWNETNWSWPARQFKNALVRTARGDRVPDQWSVGARKRGIVSGDRAILLRQHDRRGVVASGFFTSSIFVDRHWDDSERVTTYARLEWDVVLDPTDRLSIEVLKAAVPGVAWDRLQGSGVLVPHASALRLEDLWAGHVGEQEFASFEEPRRGVAYIEGAVTRVLADRFERSDQARRECLAHWGTACVVCGLQFGERYGSIGEGFIHVHHLRPLSSVGGEHEVDPVGDLRPVCPNCHAMLHAKDPAYSIESLRRRLRS